MGEVLPNEQPARIGTAILLAGFPVEVQEPLRWVEEVPSLVVDATVVSPDVHVLVVWDHNSQSRFNALFFQDLCRGWETSKFRADEIRACRS